MNSSRVNVLVGHLKGNEKYKEMWDKPDVVLLTKRDQVHPHLSRNFAPTPNEGSFAGLKVLEGKIPTDLEPGCYLRIGPNPKFDFTTNVPYHSFDGDGLIHSVTFPGNGTSASYVKRWVRTRRLVTSEQRGFDVSEIGEQLVGGFNYADHVFDSAPHGPQDKKRMGRANTNMVAHANRLFALEEQDLPYHIVASWDLDSHLRTVGKYDFQGKLAASTCTAHPKVCRKSGEMVLFSYDPVRPVIKHTVVSQHGTVDTEMLTVTLPDSEYGAMMHDFAITEHYSLLFDMRLNFDLSKFGDGETNPWVHRNDLPARFGVLPRHAKSESEVVWINVSPCAVFHFANAWEDDGNIITVIGSRMATFNFLQDTGAAQSDTPNKYGRLFEWKLDLNKRKCVSERFVDAADRFMSDFPQINTHYTGQKTRFVYAQSMIPDLKQIHAEYTGGLYLIRGLLKYDLETGEVVEKPYLSQHGELMLGTEAVFAPKVNAKSEDDGYLIVYVYDDSKEQSHCLVYNSQTLALECRLEMPERVPFGFHGYWLAGEVLK